MNPERLVAGLDIGSSRTTAIIAEAVGDAPNSPSLKILGVGNARTGGMRRGVVSDIKETTQSIQKAMREAERMAGVHPQPNSWKLLRTQFRNDVFRAIVPGGGAVSLAVVVASEET